MINTKSHCTLGKRMRLQKEKKSIKYDAGKFIRREWLTASIILRKIMKIYIENVYFLKIF